MKSLIKFYYERHTTHAKYAIVLFTLNMLLYGILCLLKADWLYAAIFGVAFVAWLPVCLITLGLVQYKGADVLLVNLSQYTFLGGLESEDFLLDQKKIDKVKALFSIRLKEAGEVINPLTIARDVAITHEFTAEEYMFVLHVAARTIQAGKINATSRIDDVELRTKLQELKEKLNNERRNNKEDKKSEDGKYDFL